MKNNKRTGKFTLAALAVFLSAPAFCAVNFKSGSASLEPVSYADLDRAAMRAIEYLSTTPSAKILVIGHTDSLGRRQANITLSERRAFAVKNYFIRKFGIDAERIATRGEGPDSPVADNATEEGRAKNRRVEIDMGESKIVLSSSSDYKEAKPVGIAAEIETRDSYLIKVTGDYPEFLLEVSSDPEFRQSMFSEIIKTKKKTFSGPSGKYYSRATGMENGNKGEASPVVDFEILAKSVKQGEYRIGFFASTGIGFPGGKLADTGKLTYEPARIGAYLLLPVSFFLMTDAGFHRVFGDYNYYQEFGTFSLGAGYELNLQSIKPFAAVKGMLAEVKIKGANYDWAYGIEAGSRFHFSENFGILAAFQYIDTDMLRQIFVFDIGLEIFTYK